LKNEGLAKYAFNALDRITDIYPPFGSRVFQKIFLFILGSGKLHNYILHKYQKKLFATKDFNKILIVADVNIGDSINTQSGIEVMRALFPDSQIDYICNKTGGDVISNSPFVDNVFKIYRNSGLPLEEDAKKINKIVEEGGYSLILNLCPFLNKKILNCDANVIHLYIVFVSYIIYLCKKNSSSLNLSLATYTFFKNYFAPLLKSKIPNSAEIEKLYLNSTYDGNKVYISDEAIEAAKNFLINNNLYQKVPLILFNLSVTIKFSMIPIELQLQIIQNVILSEDITAVLIFKGKSTINIENMIIDRVPATHSGKIVAIPDTLTISEFTALIDFCDMFVSGDTGTVHIAASRKININSINSLKNRTALVSVFGASDSRIYNYDSWKSGHSPANQDVPSKVFVGEALCRNLTCINRIVKTCKEVRCFLGLKAEDISSYIISYFKDLNINEAATQKAKVYDNGSDNNTQ